jgi:hypothetical protein
MAYDNRPNISCRQFIQETGDTFIFSGSNYFCGILNSQLGYQINCYPFFYAGNGSTSIRIGLNANTNSYSTAIGYNTCATGLRSISIGCGSAACCNDSISIGDTNVSCGKGSGILGGNDNVICSNVTGATLIGNVPPEGNTYCLDNSAYNNYVVVPNLAILNIPSGTGCYLCVDSVGKIGKTAGGTISIPLTEKISRSITLPSHGFSGGTVIGFSGGAYNKPIADGTYDGEVIGIVSKCCGINTFELTQAGYVTGLTGLSASTTYFLSDVTPGLLTTIAPTADTHINKAVLIATCTSAGWVLPYPGYIITTGGTSTGGTGGISWCGSTTDGIATYVDSTHVCSEPGLTYNGSKLEFANGNKCITMMTGTSGNQILNICGSCSVTFGVDAGDVYIFGGCNYCSSQGGGVRLCGGNACSFGGEIWLEGGMSTGNASGGFVLICGGNNIYSFNPAGAGGSIQICGGCSCRKEGGYISLLGGCSTYDCGGDAIICAGNSANCDGGDILIESGNGSGTTNGGSICLTTKKDIILSGLPAKSGETCGIYISSLGKLSYGLISGSTSGGIGWSCLSLGTTIAGCGTCSSGTTICNNTFYGVYAGLSISTGHDNVAIGTGALYSNTTGSGNTAIGSCTLILNSSGCYNTAIGKSALYSNTLGSLNTAIGHIALYNNVSGFRNVATGMYALWGNNIGCDNTANGYTSLISNSSGNKNTANGSGALYYNTIGSGNTVNGFEALHQNNSGNYNVGIGYEAGYYQTGSSKLHIANSRNCSLIYGEFNNKRLVVSGTTEIVNNSGINYFYLGDKDTNNSWRMYVSGGTNLVFERRITGTWTCKGSFAG